MGLIPGVVRRIKAIARTIKDAIAVPDFDVDEALEYDIYGKLICDVEFMGMNTIPIRVSPVTRQVIPHGVPSRLWG